MGRVEWNYLAVLLSYLNINDKDKQNEKHQAERNFQNKFNTVFTALENEIRDVKISKSTDSVSEESAGRKTKKPRGKKRSQRDQVISGTKKEIISSTKSPEDVLDLYKITGSEIKKIRADGHPLISK